MVKYRSALPTDIGYVIDTWAESFFGAPAVRVANERMMEKTNYFPGMRRLIVRIMARPKSRVMIACDEKDEDVIIAWACLEGDSVLHYIFTRRHCEDMVDLAELHGPGVKYYTHRTGRLAPKPGWAYCPFLAWNDPD